VSDGVEIPTVDMPVEVHRHRFLFHDGGVLDVLSPLSDSRVSNFAFRTYYGGEPKDPKDPRRIVGLTDLGAEAAD